MTCQNLLPHAVVQKDMKETPVKIEVKTCGDIFAFFSFLLQLFNRLFIFCYSYSIYNTVI